VGLSLTPQAELGALVAIVGGGAVAEHSFSSRRTGGYH
jgi:hypothetical protein